MSELGGELFNVDDVAAVLGVDRSRVERWLEMGALARIGTPDGPMFRRVDLEPVAAPIISPRSVSECLGLPEPDTGPLIDQMELAGASIRSRIFETQARIRPLFHYTSSDVALDHILPEGRLRLNAPTGMNDPFESEPISVSIMFDNQADADRWNPRAAMFEEASNLLRDRCRLSCLTRSGPYDYGPVGFGDGFARARMWAQYAQNHSGVCLAFDQRALRDAARKIAAAPGVKLYEAPITYRTEGGLERPIGLPYSRAADDMRDLIADIFPVLVGHLYFSKAWDWNTETEYRFLLHGDVDEYEYIDVREALTGIFCGPKLPDARLRDIVSRCPELTEAGRVFQLVWRNGVPQINPVHASAVSSGPEWHIPAAPEEPLDDSSA
jgi:hypothetical protein